MLINMFIEDWQEVTVDVQLEIVCYIIVDCKINYYF